MEEDKVTSSASLARTIGYDEYPDINPYDYSFVVGSTTSGELASAIEGHSFYVVATPHFLDKPVQPEKERQKSENLFFLRPGSVNISDEYLVQKDIEQPSLDVPNYTHPEEQAITRLQIHKPKRYYAPDDLLSAIEAEPIEDGYCHPAEEIMRKAIAEDKDALIKWLDSIISGEGPSSLAATLMRCVGRLEAPLAGEWGISLARNALQNSDLEVRDAAVQALELWGTSNAVNLLESHKESVPWLRDYISRIVKELRSH